MEGKYITISITYYGNEPAFMRKACDDDNGQLVFTNYTSYAEARRELLKLAHHLQKPITMNINRYDPTICIKQVYGWLKGE